MTIVIKMRDTKPQMHTQKSHDLGAIEGLQTFSSGLPFLRALTSGDNDKDHIDYML